MINIDETKIREAIEDQTRYWRNKGLLDITDFNLTTFSASLSGYIKGYCSVKESEVNEDAK